MLRGAVLEIMVANGNLNREMKGVVRIRYL